ncbi:MAG: ABC transporter ATP-binding protein, partial [Anaerolineales bacterium]|nr:ABC transporter ATP-binding protein [Anaerolineales bacterium]
VNDLTKTYYAQHGQVEALDRVSLTVAAGEFVTIIGPSGCGKSTLARILAGLEEASSGEIVMQTSGNGTQPLTAMVFQDYALFPWRTVQANVTFGLERRGMPAQQRKATADKYLALTGLADFARYYPHQLSGGMKQRVALARALAVNAEVLLMDEPFAALDAQTRTLLQEELLRLWAHEQKTVIYITHAIEEAVLLSDRVIVLTARPGRVKAIYPIDLPRPRQLGMRSLPAFTAAAERIWADLVEEIQPSRMNGVDHAR